MRNDGRKLWQIITVRGQILNKLTSLIGFGYFGVSVWYYSTQNALVRSLLDNVGHDLLSLGSWGGRGWEHDRVEHLLWDLFDFIRFLHIVICIVSAVTRGVWLRYTDAVSQTEGIMPSRRHGILTLSLLHNGRAGENRTLLLLLTHVGRRALQPLSLNFPFGHRRWCRFLVLKVLPPPRKILDQIKFNKASSNKTIKINRFPQNRNDRNSQKRT